MTDAQRSNDAIAGDQGERIARAAAEYIRRRTDGAAVDLAAFLAEHAEIAAELEAELRRWELVADARRRAAQADSSAIATTAAAPPSASEFQTLSAAAVNSRATALTLRCPHCQARLNLADDADLSAVPCASCGLRINLLAQPDETGVGDFIAHFELLRRLGAGQFGEVWLARDHELDRTVAIKLPRARQLELWDVEQFLREARAAAQLRHPGIVSVYEVGRDAENLYIVSEYVAGGDLVEYLHGAAIAPREAAALVEQIAVALHHAHEAGVVHRDLKPSNILIDGHGNTHLVDFGLAKRDRGEITMTLEGRIVGTPAYMSPEQARGESHHADRRSDVYSAGVILFEMLTGELPFRGNLRMLIAQILNEEPPAPRKFNARVPLDLQTIVLKCLEKSPARRYATAQDLADELRRHLEGRPILARPVGSGERLWRWIQRNPTPAALISAVVASLSLGTVVSLLFAWQASTRAAEARRHAYVTEANLLERDWRDHRNANVVERLQSQLPAAGQTDLRGWEWYYQWRLCHADVRTLAGHADSLTDVSFSTDGVLIATASHDRTVRLWNAATGKLTRECAPHQNVVTAIAFSPQRGQLAAVDRDGTLVIYGVADGQVVTRVDTQCGALADVVWSATGDQVFIAGRSRQVHVFSVREGKQIRSWDAHAQPVQALAISPDGRWIASCSGDRLIHVWNAATGERTATCTGHAQGVNSIAFSRDGQLLASGGDDQTVRIWKAASGEFVRTHAGHTQAVTCVAMNPTNDEVVSCSRDMTVRRWPSNHGASERIILGHTSVVTSVCFRGDGKQLVTGSYDRTAKVWDDSAGQDYREFTAHQSAVAAIAPIDGSIHVASAGWDGAVRIWDLNRREAHRECSLSNIVFVDLAALGNRLAVAADNGEVLLLNATNASLVKRIKVADTLIASVTAIDDGSLLAVGDNLGAVSCWDPEAGKQLWRKPAHDDAVADLAAHPDGKHLISVGGRRLCLWATSDGQRLKSIEAHENNITGVRFSPDGDHFVTTSMDQTAAVWRFPQFVKQATLRGHENSVMCAAFTHDGRRLATGGADQRVMLWDVASAQSVRELDCGAQVISALVFTDHDERLVAGTTSGALLIWEAAGKERKSPPWTGKTEAALLRTHLVGAKSRVIVSLESHTSSDDVRNPVPGPVASETSDRSP